MGRRSPTNTNVMLAARVDVRIGFPLQSKFVLSLIFSIDDLDGVDSLRFDMTFR